MSSLSPEQNGVHPPHSSPNSDDQGRGIFNLNFFRTQQHNQAPRTDGTQPKRRGPKPDSKPALTRRQELNRQAQRTHRERKELYVKALEEEVLRLKEIYSLVSHEKDKVAEENQHLRYLLAQNGIGITDQSNGSSSASGNLAGSQSGGFSPAHSQSTAPSYTSSSHQKPPTGQQLRNMMQQASATGKGIDYDQAGIDFVLTLERPCMDHLPFLMDRRSEENEPCGHALMASCPPQQFDQLPQDARFNSHMHIPPTEADSGQKVWELSKGDLAVLLDLSARLDLDGEITPVMAWGMIMSHPRFMHLEVHDFVALADELSRKVRCFGYGAVTEEFEVRDAIESVLATAMGGMMI